MQKQDDILQNAGETFEYANQYIQTEIQLLKLEGAERIAKSTSSLITLAVISFLATMVLIMLSIAAGFWLGNIMGSYTQGFLIITLVYALIALLVYLFKKTLVTTPVLTAVIASFFD